MILLVCMTIGAQIKGNNITVTVQPDHSDWNYHVGQTAQFTVSVLKSGTPLANAQVDYEAGPVMYPSIYKKGVTLKDGVIHLTGKLTVRASIASRSRHTSTARTMTDCARQPLILRRSCPPHNAPKTSTIFGTRL